MTSTRRRFLHYASFGAAALAAGGCSLRGGHPAAPHQNLGANLTVEHGEPAAPAGKASVVQVVAHADDDMYFINPETQAFLRAGVPLLSVYLTAGESTGLGPKSPAVRKGEVPVSDRSQYAAARFYGLRRSYAQMVTGDHDSPWTRTTTTLTTGVLVEVDTLDAAPHVRLVLLNLIESGDLRRQYRGRNLRGLIDGTAKSVPTLVLAGSPVTRGYAYTRENVLDALGALLVRARPTLVCTLDHDPEHKPGAHGKGVRPTDHIDHTAAAQFTVTAVERYRPPQGVPVPVLQSYRGYANELWPRTLDPRTQSMKTALLTVYSGRGLPCGVRTGCGDHNVDNLRPSLKRFASTQHRYQGDTGWLRALPDGRLTAFTVAGGQVRQWTQAAAGGTVWNAPVPLPGAGLLGQVAAVTLPDGRIRLFAVRHGGLVNRPAAQRRAIVTCAQTSPGGRFDAWRSLGGPDGTAGARAREIGLPYAAVDGAGRIHLVVRTYTRQLALRICTPAGEWGAWTVLRGAADVQDGVCLLPRTDGRTEIFAGTRDRLLRWTVTGGVPSAAVRLPLPVPSCAPTAVELPGGRVRLFLRPAASAQVHVHDERGGVWSPARPLQADGGYGPVAVAPVRPGPGGVAATHLTAARNDAGAVSVRLWTGTGASAPKVTDHPRLMIGTPSLATDGNGRMYFSELGADGQLNVTRLNDQESTT